jgi:hypothetical protein
MDIASLIILGKALLGKEPKDIGRPDCGPNSKAVYNQQTKEWQCVFGLD